MGHVQAERHGCRRIRGGFPVPDPLPPGKRRTRKRGRHCCRPRCRFRKRRLSAAAGCSNGTPTLSGASGSVRRWHALHEEAVAGRLAVPIDRSPSCFRCPPCGFAFALRLRCLPSRSRLLGALLPAAGIRIIRSRRRNHPAATAVRRSLRLIAIQACFPTLRGPVPPYLRFINSLVYQAIGPDTRSSSCSFDKTDAAPVG